MARGLDVKHLSTKVCSRCEIDKPLTEYGVDNRRDIPKAICKQCDREVHRLRYYDPAKQSQVRAQRIKSNKWTISSFSRKKAAGICYSCDKQADAGLYCSRHAEERKHKECERRRASRPICQDCGTREIPLGRRRCCAECALASGEVRHSKQRLWAAKEKEICFSHYGGYVCVCCGETEVAFLTLDHIGNDGAPHRKEIGHASIYRWLKRNGYPPGFQAMCLNCNRGKWMNGGICPHKTN